MADRMKMTKQRKDMKRYEALRTFMSSLTLTAVVIVAAAISIPKSPIATIDDIQVFHDKIAYQITVTDEEHALDADDLKIVLEGPLETYQVPILLGQSAGVFEDLQPETGYHLSVYGNKGFGDERLASMRITTNPASNGAIVSYDLIETFDFFLHYQVRVLLDDIEAIYDEVNLYYTYLYPGEEPSSYDVITITLDDQIIELMDVPDEPITVDIYLEATLIEGGTVILDELSFSTPFKLSTSLYLEQRSKNHLSYTFYRDYYNYENVSYQATLYQGYMKVETIEIDNQSEDMHHGGAFIEFWELDSATSYRIEIHATYVDPNTLREETVLLHTQEAETLGWYDVSHSLTITTTHWLIEIEVVDPDHYFQIPYYFTYEIIDGHINIIDSDIFGFTPDGAAKHVTFEIPIPPIDRYRVIIGIRNQNDLTIQHIIVDQTIEN